ncbi:OprO/OprP family phosphate-selective porin [Flavobacteriaceae bacterium F08102]|nr:OprO/OprP family phosphate-selective porin [Flavobacteriaceae bacterium F08102]
MASRFLLWKLLMLCSTLAFSQEKDPSFTLTWDNGFKIMHKNSDFSFKFGGRIMIDHAFFSQDSDTDAIYGPLLATTGTEFRRGRVYLSGLLYQNIEFKLQAEMVAGLISLKDAYIGIRDLPGVGTLRIGHVKEPIRLSGLTSSKYNTFMERSFLNDFSQTRNNGLLVFNDFINNRLSYQLGYFRNSDKNGNNTAVNKGYVFTGRFSGLPIHQADGRRLLHLGFAHSYRVPSTEDYRIAAGPEAHLSTKKYINTGLIEAVDRVQLSNIEGALVMGSTSLQGEYMIANIESREKYQIHTGYGQLSYFLTGEYRRYKSSYGGFDRIHPNRNFSGKNTGPGAIEIALRYSYANFNDKNLTGGEQENITLGVNWYLNPATRIMLNNIWADIKHVGKANIFQLRFQLDF